MKRSNSAHRERVQSVKKERKKEEYEKLNGKRCKKRKDREKQTQDEPKVILILLLFLMCPLMYM